MRREEKRKRILINIFAILLMIYIIIPFVWLFISSISPKVELIATPPHWIPEEPSFNNCHGNSMDPASHTASRNP